MANRISGYPVSSKLTDRPKQPKKNIDFSFRDVFEPPSRISSAQPLHTRNPSPQKVEGRNAVVEVARNYVNKENTSRASSTSPDEISPKTPMTNWGQTNNQNCPPIKERQSLPIPKPIEQKEIKSPETRRQGNTCPPIKEKQINNPFKTDKRELTVPEHIKQANIPPEIKDKQKTPSQVEKKESKPTEDSVSTDKRKPPEIKYDDIFIMDL